MAQKQTGSISVAGPHYKQTSIEAIDVIEDWNLDFNQGNIVKYIARAKHKGTELQDLRKIAWYAARAIALLEARRLSS